MAGYDQLLQNEQVQRRRAQFLPQVQALAAEQGIPWQLLDAVILRESRYDPRATGTSGERGLGQLMPGTAKMLGVAWDSAYDPTANLRGAASYLGQAYKRAGGDWGQAALGYNAGLGRIGTNFQNAGAQDYARYAANAQAIAGGSAPSAPSAPSRPVTSGALGLGLGAGFTGVDYPQIAPLQTVSTAPAVPPVQATPLPRRLSLSELFRYANYEPPAGWNA